MHLKKITDPRGSVSVCGKLFSLQKVVQSAAGYCAVRLLISGNYWRDRLSVCGKLFSRQPSTMPLDCRSTKFQVRWTLSLRRVLIKGTVTVPLDLKVNRQYCSNRLFIAQYSSIRVSQRYGTSPLD